jgi:hypothetical protein
MRIYLDNCSIQRPPDDRSQPRVNIEAEAVLTILRFVASGDLELLSSDSLVDEIETHAAGFVKAGLKPLDALHLASAVWNRAEFFALVTIKYSRRKRN